MRIRPERVDTAAEHGRKEAAHRAAAVDYRLGFASCSFRLR